MIMVARFRLTEAETPGFLVDAERAVALMSSRPGVQSVELGRNLDDPELWTIVSRWADVGSYRRGIGGYDGKMIIAPLLSRAIDEPTAYDDPEHVGENIARGTTW